MVKQRGRRKTNEELCLENPIELCVNLYKE